MEVRYGDRDNDRGTRSKKKIGTWGSYVIMVNSIIGPGIVVLPLTFQRVGWGWTLMLLIGYCVVSTLCVLFLADAMTKIPGNDNHRGRVEFLQLAETFLGTQTYRVVIGLFFASLMATSVSAIVQASQVIDHASLSVGSACALQMTPKLEFVCVGETDSPFSDSVFGDSWVLSLGLVVLFVAACPLSFLSLSDNLRVQLVSFLALSFVCLVWCGYFVTLGLKNKVPAFGSSGSSFAFVLFNFAYVVTAPSWINEKQPGVDVHEILVAASGTGLLFFTVPCLLAALSINFEGSETLLAYLTREDSPVIIQMMTFVYTVSELITCIPIVSIVMRNNLIENEIIKNRSLANLVAIGLPWIFAFLSYGGDNVNYILVWAGIITAGPLNFIVPAGIFLLTTKYTLIESADDYSGTGERKAEDLKLGVTRRRGALEEKNEEEDEPDVFVEKFEGFPKWQRGRILLLPYVVIILALTGTIYAAVITTRSQAQM